MVTLQILVLSFLVRIRVSQQQQGVNFMLTPFSFSYANTAATDVRFAYSQQTIAHKIFFRILSFICHFRAYLRGYQHVTLWRLRLSSVTIRHLHAPAWKIMKDCRQHLSSFKRLTTKALHPKMKDDTFITKLSYVCEHQQTTNNIDYKRRQTDKPKAMFRAAEHGLWPAETPHIAACKKGSYLHFAYSPSSNPRGTPRLTASSRDAFASLLRSSSISISTFDTV